MYYVNVSFSRLITRTSVWEERAGLSATVYLFFCCFCSKDFTLPECACERLHYLIVALPLSSIKFTLMIH